MEDIALSQEQKHALAMPPEVARSLLSYGCAGALIADDQHGRF
ncbi:hypothetical protein [Bradyrhizobium sp. Leo121]|nr:hypothetical protein [Bradyrhizobium sp. Leo121]